MPPRRPSRDSWPLERKFALWLADQGTSLRAFARRHGFAEQTLRGWMKLGVRLPAEGLARIAKAACLPEAYWLNETLPSPPPLDYLNSRERAAGVLTTLSADDVAWVIEIASDPAKLRQARALWNAARGTGPT